MTASLLVKAEDSSEGDVILLPWERTATIESIQPFGKRAQFVNFRTENGRTRIRRDQEVHIAARPH